MRTKSSAGFTLLEVMMATVLLAVGSVSIIMVLTSAAAYAKRRAEVQRLTQVFEEARSQAQHEVNRFVPSGERKVPGPKKDAKPKPKPGEEVDPDEEGADARESLLYTGFSYEIHYAPVNSTVPEMGFDARIVIRFNNASVHEGSVVVASDTIPLSEFESSITYDAERQGTDDTGGASESK